MAGNYRGIPNHVQIGINDTPLTVALEKGDFRTAEKLIEESLEPSFLDEGPFEKIPLALVLSNDTDFRNYPRHLRLAKLLVEGGANPNLRIPQAEWQGASPSPMEYLLELYENVVCRYEKGGEKSDGDEYEIVDPFFTIGLHDEPELTHTELESQLLDLIDTFIACGGNPNVTTNTSNSTLFHTIVAHTDPNVELILKLCEAGGDLNQTNVHGTTPLMDLITHAEGDLALGILHDIWRKRPNISSIHSQNCSNETALWRAMFAGSPGVAIELLQKGASPVPGAAVNLSKWRHSSRLPVTFASELVTGLSAMYAPLLVDSSSYTRLTTPYSCLILYGESPPHQFNVHQMNKVISSAISPIVDTIPAVQCFPDPVLNEMEAVIRDETYFKLHSICSNAVKPRDVAVLMFGNLSAGLQQMCVRVIMNSIFFSQDTSKSMALIAQLKRKKIISLEEYEKQVRESNSNHVPENWDKDDISLKSDESIKEKSDNKVTHEREVNSDDLVSSKVLIVFDKDVNGDNVSEVNNGTLVSSEFINVNEDANDDINKDAESEERNKSDEGDKSDISVRPVERNSEVETCDEIKENISEEVESWGDDDVIMESEFNSKGEYIFVEDVTNITHREVILELNPEVIRKVVREYLKLPASLVNYFEIEAVRLQIGAGIYGYESTDCMQGCDGQSDEESSDLFAEDESEDEESDWFSDVMSSDEYDDSVVDWESVEEESSSNDGNSDDNDNSNWDDEKDKRKEKGKHDNFEDDSDIDEEDIDEDNVE